MGLIYVRRVVIAVIGGTVVLIGVIMLVTPGPAIVVIPLGLGILAVEFVWARRLLARLEDRARSVVGGVGKRATGDRSED
jgi:uncharacterized protein (TIGR02611 family)